MKEIRNGNEFPELLTGGEVQRLAGLTPGVWAELLETMRLPKPVEVGGRLKWRKSDVIDWINHLQPVTVAERQEASNG